MCMYVHPRTYGTTVMYITKRTTRSKFLRKADEREKKKKSFDTSDEIRFVLDYYY